MNKQYSHFTLSAQLLLLFAALCLSASHAAAQETRGTIIGTVRDASSAAVASARIEANNTGTGITTTAQSNAAGVFELPYLTPGTYDIAASAQGFKRVVQPGVVVSVGSRINLNLEMEVGQLSEEIVISGAAPILDTASPNGSATLNEAQIKSLPVFGNSALLTARSVPGLQWTGQPNYLGLHSNVGASAISAAGGVGGTEFTLDGVPNSAVNRRVGFLPNTDSVEEIKVDIANFDARSGHTSGATISMTTKSGTNQYHGALSWLHWQQRFNATQSTTNAAYWGPIEAARARGDQAVVNRLLGEERQTSGRSNNYSGAIGGPVWLPEKFFGPLGWDGRERLFFFFSYSGLIEKKSEEANAINRTVPTLLQRQGNFSELLAIDPVRFQIYDPRTARCSDNLPAPCNRAGVRVIRDPFPGNIVPILNPLYNAYVNLYPLPNNVPGVVSREGANNYLASATPFDWDYEAYQNRVDFHLTARQKLSGKWSWNSFIEDRGDWTYATARGLHSNGLVRKNLGITLDYVLALNATTSLNFSVGYNRFIEGNELNATQLSGSPGQAGLPGYVDDKAGDFKRLPQISVDGYNGISGGYPGFGRYSVGFTRGEMSKIAGNHTFVTGYDLRHNYRSNNDPGNTSGSFSFSNAFVRRRDDNVDNSGSLGLAWAAFALGVPSGVSIGTNDSIYLTNPYRAAYFQDNWRFTPKLTLNLGFRLEYEGGFRERFNRGLPGFDPNINLPISQIAQAEYAAIYAALPQNDPNDPRRRLLPSSIEVRGGSLYLGQNGAPETVNRGNWSYLPRAGFAYQWNDKTVLRGGYGIFADTINVLNEGLDQFGYSRATNTIITNNSGVTFENTDLSNNRTIFSDPFPLRANGTRFDVPLGNALGPMARVGRGQTYINYNWENAKQHRWRFGIQREITKNMALELAYLGSYTPNLSTVSNNPGDTGLSRTISFLPEQYWASGLVRRQDIADALNTPVRNPFRLVNFATLRESNPTLYADMESNGFFTAETRSVNQLLRAFPHMNGLTITRVPRGKLKYQHLEVSLNQRLSQGVTFMTAYTWAASQVRDFVENEFEEDPVYRQNVNYRPHHFMFNFVGELPFGKGKKFLADNRWLGGVLGGWQVSSIYHLQSGRVYDFGNHFFYSDNLRALRLTGDERTTDRWFNWQLFPGAGRDYVAFSCANPTGREVWESRMRGLVPASIIGQLPARAVPNCVNGQQQGTRSEPASFDNVTPTDFQAAGFHRRVFPSRFNWLRGDRMTQLDLSLARRIRLGERTGFEFRVDMINALNNVQWDNPSTDVNNANFGRVTQQWNTPRWIQFQARFEF